MTQVLYPLCLAVYAWCSKSDPTFYPDPTFDHFSSSYCALVLFVVLCILCSKKDLSIFMKIGSFGVFFIVFLMIFIIVVGIVAFGNSSFTVGTSSESNNVDWASNERVIVLFNSNVSPLAGILCAGYFLHTCSLPIVRSSANPEKQIRDVFIGYLLVFISYAVCGSLGYIGFLGFSFSDYFESVESTATAGQIDQNCMNMFDYTNVPAFILRLAIFMLLFSTYPLVHYFLNTILLNLFARNVVL